MEALSPVDHATIHFQGGARAKRTCVAGEKDGRIANVDRLAQALKVGLVLGDAEKFGVDHGEGRFNDCARQWGDS